MKRKLYGHELVLDIAGCDPKTFNRKDLRKFFKALCIKIDMKRAKLVFWDDHGVAPKDRQTLPHLKGTTAVQFIMTSNVTIHTLDILESVTLNIFSCKNFNPRDARKFCVDWFGGKVINRKFYPRYTGVKK